MPDPLLRGLDLEISRRLEGLLAGDFRAVSLGPGTELAQVRPYEAGDDVRDIEWNVTARTGEPHVRVKVAERVVTTWVVLDVSASMTFGTAERRKADVAEGVALAVGHVSTRRGNRLGIMTFGDGAAEMIPPAQGKGAMLRLLTALRRRPPTERLGTTSLGSALRRGRGIFRARSVVFVISDLRGRKDWRSPLMQLASRHDVVGVEVRDPREEELVDVGDVVMLDPETGRHLRVNTAHRGLRERYAQAAAAERAQVALALRSTRTDHVVLYTAGDWLRDLAIFLRRRGARR